MASNITVFMIAALVITGGVGAYILIDNDDGRSEKEGAINVVDHRGVRVSFDKAPERIMSLGSSFTDTLVMLGCMDQINTVDQSSIRRLADLGEEYAQLSSKNALTSGAPGTSTAEIAIMRNIDCIILWNFNMYATGIQQMENAGLKVVALNPNDVASVLDVISIIGTLMDKEDIAAELIGNIGSTIENITELAKEKAGAGYGNFKRVYIELDTASRTSPGTNSITGAMLDMLGVNYISKANGVTASRSYGEEEIIGFNPDIMIFMGPIVPCGYDVRNFGTFVSYDPVTYNSGEGFNGNWASATPSFINGLIFLYELIYGEAYAP